MYDIFTDYQCYFEGSLYGYEYDHTSGTCGCKPGWYSEICHRSKLDRRENFLKAELGLHMNIHFTLIKAFLHHFNL